MSYDLRFAVKAENGQYVTFMTPEYDTPTYNVGTIFRKAMNFDFKQGEYYRVSDIIDNIMHGLKETTINAGEYKSYEPENGWGSVDTVRRCLESILDSIKEIKDYDRLPLEYVYLAW